MSLFDDDDDLFGRPSTDSDLWSLPQPKVTSPKDRLASLLAGASVPNSYDSLFMKAKPINGQVSLIDLQSIVNRSGLDNGTNDLIVNLVTKGKSQPSINRDVWNVAMALIGLAQNGEDDLGLDAVDFNRNNLPDVRIIGVENGHHHDPLSVTLPYSRESSIGSDYQSSPPVIGWGATDESSINPSSEPLPASIPSSTTTDPAQNWTSSSDPNNYNPTSKDTIVISVVPEREGIFMFRHVVYNLEGTISFSEYSNTPKSFKVIRRYSNFLWLQDCLVKKYPFRLLPVLPPKRLTVDGRYLSSDSYFLERRRRGLSRFINQLVKHPLLRKDKLVAMFLTVDTEPSVWQKQATLKVEEEFAQRIISPSFVAKWNQDEEMKKWRSVIEASEQSLEYITQLTFIADRISRREEAMSADYNKMSQALTHFSENVPKIYFHPSGEVPVINAGLSSAIKYTSTASMLLRDESQSIDIGFLEELKQLREFLTSFKEIFVRYEKFGSNRIEELQKRLELNTTKLNQIKNRPDARESEVLRLKEFIANDKKNIEKQRNRDWLIKECITEEILLFQKTQYQISKILSGWSVDNVKYAELHSENWGGFNNDVCDLPMSN